MTQALKRISPFHKELAKRVARGDRNSEILSSMKISASRLSVLKGNPLFKSIVADFEDAFNDNFQQAHKALEERAVDVAEGLANIATNPNVPPNVRVNASFGIMDRIGMTKDPKGGGTKKAVAGEVVFEQMLRVVKKQMDDDGDEMSEAYNQLEDLGPDTIDINPEVA